MLQKFSYRFSHAAMRIFLILGVVSSLVLVGVIVGVGTPAYSRQATGSKYVGVHRCRGCHEKAYRVWSRSAHAHAYKRLPKEDRKNPTCLRCHSTGKASHLQGVQCESCHGGGRYYSSAEVMADGELARAVGLKVIKGEAGCKKCHASNSPKIRRFDYNSMWKKIVHSK